MKKNRYIFIMRDGRRLGVHALCWQDAEALVKAFCVLKGASYSLREIAEERLFAKVAFAQMWEEARLFELVVNNTK